jgi:hypothetical protein
MKPPNSVYNMVSVDIGVLVKKKDGTWDQHWTLKMTEAR